MNRLVKSAMTAGATLALAAGVALAATFTLSPWTFDPDDTGGVVSQVEGDGDLRLEKNVPTATNASAGAEIQGVEGLSTTGLTLEFDVDGYCGAGAPRFNVYLESGATIFLGCIHGDADVDGHVSFTAGETYGGVLFPEGETVTGIDIVQDEEGQTTLSNIMVNGEEVMLDAAALKEQCKKGGWQDMTDADGNSFRNQGQCVSYFARMQN
jgi:hypothetical protein